MYRRTAFPIVVTVGAVLALSVPAAHATYAGKRGPIVFTRSLNPMDESTSQLFTLSPASGQVRQLSNVQGGAFNPDISPNGKQIAFEHRFKAGRDEAFTIGIDGSALTRIPIACSGPCLGIDEPNWTRNGDDIAFNRPFAPVIKGDASRNDLETAALSGRGDRVIRSFGRKATGNEPHMPAWSPDGRMLAVIIENTTTKPFDASAIYLISASGAIIRRLTPANLDAGNPDWAPNGKRILFNSFYEGQSESELYTIRPDGTGMHRILKERKNNYAFDPVWSPDGGRIAFVHASRNTPPHIWSIGADGKKLRQETHGNHVDLSPDWGVPPR